MKRIAALSLLASIAVAGAARPEVLDAQPGGFTVRQTLVVKAPVRAVWDALVRPAAWWASEHTFSGDARNLTLTPKAGGEWLESLPGGGGVRHLVVVYASAPSVLRMEGALGPLQALGATGHLTFTLKDQAGATVLTESYDVGGHAPGGLDKLAGPVDEVLGLQLTRLRSLAQTGKTP